MARAAPVACPEARIAALAARVEAAEIKIEAVLLLLGDLREQGIIALNLEAAVNRWPIHQ